jgi:hypothetical protein
MFQAARKRSLLLFVFLTAASVGVGSEANPTLLSPSASSGKRLFSAGELRYAMSRVPSSCLDPARSGNPDILRHLSAIRSARLCYRPELVDEGRFQWRFHVFHHPEDPAGPFWVLPHDDEDAAFEAAVHAVDTYGGGFLAIDTGQRRYFRGQDPNRNFSTTWSESALCREQARPAPLFTAAVLKHYKRSRGFPYLSLHNNDNGWRENGGRGTVSVYRNNSVLRGMRGTSATAALRDEDNLVYIAGTRPFASDPDSGERARALNRLGLNVVYRHVTSRSFNCSLSDYVTWNRLGDYYNIEAQHGRADVQKRMVDRLMKHLGRRPVHKSFWDGDGLFGGYGSLGAGGG